jgi:translation elongation factor EF-G
VLCRVLAILNSFRPSDSTRRHSTTTHPILPQAFRTATKWAVWQAYEKAAVQVLEPIMAVEIETPNEFQSQAIALVSKRRGAIRETQLQDGDSMKVRRRSAV